MRDCCCVVLGVSTMTRFSINWLNVLVVAVIFFSSILLLLRRSLYLAQLGGGSFQYADWLINFSSGIVRRGFSGEFILTLSDLIGVGPVWLVSMVQAIVIAAIILALFIKGLQIGMPDYAVILLLSPFLILLWANDHNNAYRKEIVGMFALFPMLLFSLGVTRLIISSSLCDRCYIS